MGVSLAADAAPGHDEGLPVPGQVGQDLAGVGVLHDRADRDGDHDVLRAAAGSVAALAGTAPLGDVVLLVLQVQQGPAAAHGPEDHIPALAAVAAVRPATGHEFLPPEADAALAAVTRLDVDFRFVDEFHKACRENPLVRERSVEAGALKRPSANAPKKKRHFCKSAF